MVLTAIAENFEVLEDILLFIDEKLCPLTVDKLKTISEKIGIHQEAVSLKSKRHIKKLI